ncbi:MAG: hypothetical protein AABX04_00050 [Nanoarchaeota archaeon]
MDLKGIVGFYDHLNIPSDLSPAFRARIIKHDALLKEERRGYLHLIRELASKGLITPLLYRELTPKGRELTQEFFQGEDNFGNKPFVDNVEGLIEIVRLLSLSVFLPRTQPCLYCELDAFVFEMSDQLFRIYLPTHSQKLEQLSGRASIPKPSFFIMGGIEIASKGIESRLLEVNLPEINRNSCYLKFLNVSDSEPPKILKLDYPLTSEIQ